MIAHSFCALFVSHPLRNTLEVAKHHSALLKDLPVTVYSDYCANYVDDTSSDSDDSGLRDVI